MELKNIKANFLGDSITEGVGTSDKTKTFHQLIAAKYGMAAARNYGISGTRIAKQSAPSEYSRHDLDYCMRFSEMDDDASLIVVFGGTNDYGHGDAKIGCFEDRTSDTFYGACHYLMSGLLVKYPDAQIVFMTPLHRCGELNKNRNGYVLKQYVDIIKEVAEYYSIPVIDLWALSGIQPGVGVIKEKFCPDGLHPNDAGHIKMAELIGNYLLKL